MIKFLYVTRVQSLAFPNIVPAFGNIGKAFNLVPTTAWETAYRGATIEWHSKRDLNRYVAEKVGAGALLIH